MISEIQCPSPVKKRWYFYIFDDHEIRAWRCEIGSYSQSEKYPKPTPITLTPRLICRGMLSCGENALIGENTAAVRCFHSVVSSPMYPKTANADGLVLRPWITTWRHIQRERTLNIRIAPLFFYLCYWLETNKVLSIKMIKYHWWYWLQCIALQLAITTCIRILI
jgi:hypothetical protein